MVNQLLAMARAEDKTGLAARAGRSGRDHARDGARLRPAGARQNASTSATKARMGSTAPPLVCRAAVLIRELVRNLVDNALQYTPRGGTVTARVTPDPFGQVVVLQVEDTGPGIAPGERELVFQPVHSRRWAPTSTAAGSG